MRIIGPALDERAQCEEVLRSLPQWFGIESALLGYADDSARLPGFAALEGGRLLGFVSLLRHFPYAWELHCMAVRAEARHRGIGRALLGEAERWVAAQGASLLQVKTVAATSSSAAYAQTRAFYARMGFEPLEVFPHLWAPQNPALQLVKPVGGGPAANRSMPGASVIPVLHYADVPQASDWLCRAFGFGERLRIGTHRVQLHAGIPPGAVVVAQASPPGGAAGPPVSVMVRVRDVDAHHARAVAAGAAVAGAPADFPYGERQYSASDLGGHRWTFTQTLADVDPASWGGALAAGDAPPAPPG